ncbi:replication initiation factor domain-containing protein [Listeria costaricensis]|uniref:replication initiation factor domain-containing protein n=1 Tax=Listeria costaricensis TaxID=2026604 RepID=UPI000C085BEE|nr:replication initiation factor domain-containing protein [Listeria costaricensis]
MQLTRNNLSVKLDYLCIVFENIVAQEVLEKLIWIEPQWCEIQPRTIKFKKYTRCYSVGAIHVYGDVPPSEDNPNGLGAYLSLTGAGCQELQSLLDVQRRKWHEFFSDCYDYTEGHLHTTRLDLAIDDKNEKPFFTIQQLYKKCQREEFRSRSRYYELRASRFDENDTGKTLYIGNPKSDIIYRFYDKDKEQAGKHKCELEAFGSWKRTEIQLRNSVAHAIFLQILFDHNTLSQCAFNFLNDNLNFLVEDKEQQNKSRWKTCRFWKRFLGAAESMPLSRSEKNVALHETQKWLVDGGALAILEGFHFLEKHHALGELESLQEMKKSTQFSASFADKLVTHLVLIGRQELIPLVHEQTKQAEF